MDKTTFRKFARLVGNEEDLLPLESDDIEDEPIVNEDGEEEEVPVQANAQKPESLPEQKPVQKSVSKPAEIPAEIAQLNTLVTELGGVDALKTMLLAAATVTANSMQQEANERDTLTQVIMTNSAGQWEEEDLKEIPLPALRKIAATFGPTRHVDYGALGAVNSNAKKDAIAPRPSFFNQTAKAN